LYTGATPDLPEIALDVFVRPADGTRLIPVILVLFEITVTEAQYVEICEVLIAGDFVRAGKCPLRAYQP